MPTKKTLIVKTTQDVSMFTDEYIEKFAEQLRRSAVLRDRQADTIVEIEVRKEDSAETPMNLVDRLLQSVRSEFKASDAPAEGSDDLL